MTKRLRLVADARRLQSLSLSLSLSLIDTTLWVVSMVILGVQQQSGMIEPEHCYAVIEAKRISFARHLEHLAGHLADQHVMEGRIVLVENRSTGYS